jgi:predicted CXXCH cytochrome family protein
MASCGASGCHDGKPVFAITTACTKCHSTPPADKFTVERPPERFSHAVHDSAKLACAVCHPLGKTGEVLVAGHAACAGCHADDFSARVPTKCGACHNATEPWRKLVADRPPPERTEFGATLDHSKHSSDCKSCHSLRTASSQLRPPRGHRACTGSTCHAVNVGPAPKLAACEGCHAIGLLTSRATARASTPWSVRPLFDHVVHQRDAAGSELACTSCHEDLTGSSIGALATPAKKTCAPCHDGRASFKLTGTTCMRCHPGVKP